MTEADFGFDETEWLQGADQAEEGDNDHDVVREVLPQLEITESMTVEEKTKILQKRYPEFSPLAKEFLELQPIQDQLSLDSAAAQAVLGHQKATTTPIEKIPPVATVKWRALQAYLASISMYFAILAHGGKDSSGKLKPRAPEELREHPIMDDILKCREIWQKAKDANIPELAEKLDIHPNISGNMDETQTNGITTSQDVSNPSRNVAAKKKKTRKSKAVRAAEKALIEAESRRAERQKRAEDDLAKLSGIGPKAPSNPNRAIETPVDNDDYSDFGEETTMTAQEAADKARRKKSLRFYSSQIISKAKKRENAGREVGGDGDLPHRERLRDRQARKNAEAEARGHKKATAADQLGGESDEEDRRVAKEMRVGNDDDDYYNQVRLQLFCPFLRCANKPII